MRRSRLAAGGAAVLVMAGSLWGWADRSEAWKFKAHAMLQGPAGEELGRVTFTGWDDRTDVRVRLWAVPEGAAVDAFHGFHLHANNNSANGDGCIADPAGPANTWFVSADGHWAEEGQQHANHRGDLPSLLVNADGTAEARFRTGRFPAGEVENLAVILHAGPDNFGNVPVGTGPTEYTANSPDAVTATRATGNSGNRIACGVVTLEG